MEDKLAALYDITDEIISFIEDNVENPAKRSEVLAASAMLIINEMMFRSRRDRFEARIAKILNIEEKQEKPREAPTREARGFRVPITPKPETPS